MGGLSVAERRRLAEIERHLRADARLATLLSAGTGPTRSRRRHRTGRVLPLPWILLVSWVVLGLLFIALLSGALAPVVAAGAVGIAVVLLKARSLHTHHEGGRYGPLVRRSSVPGTAHGRQSRRRGR